MQTMKCEICGNSDIIKQEGFFVCQHCGTKYTVEEARKLIGVVKNDQSDESLKYLTLARRARQDRNYIDANKYYELILQEYPDNWEAFFYQRYYQVFCASESDLGILGKSFPNSMVSFVQQLKADNSRTDKESTLLEMRAACITLADYLFQVYKDSKTKNTGAGSGARWIFEKFRDAVAEHYPEYSDIINQLNNDAQIYTEKVQKYTESIMTQQLNRMISSW